MSYVPLFYPHEIHNEGTMMKHTIELKNLDLALRQLKEQAQQTAKPVAVIDLDQQSDNMTCDSDAIRLILCLDAICLY
jgi:hypothetical protein